MDLGPKLGEHSKCPVARLSRAPAPRAAVIGLGKHRSAILTQTRARAPPHVSVTTTMSAVARMRLLRSRGDCSA
jgi:hypothetical protein